MRDPVSGWGNGKDLCGDRYPLKRRVAMDFRKHPRFEVNVPVEYSGDEIAGKGAVTNLSLGGCAIFGESAVRVGSF